MPEKTRIILADDHSLVVEGLAGLINQQDDLRVVAIANDGDVLLGLLQEHEADVVVMDWQMPYHGQTALEEIRRQNFPVKVLVLTAFADGETIQSALSLNAEGFALKTESPMQTLEAIRQVAQGRLVFPKAAQKWLSQHSQVENTQQTLSSREREVLSYLARGKTNTEIAQDLSISDNTVRFHLKNIFEKLGVTNRTEAAAWFFTHNNNIGNPFF